MSIEISDLITEFGAYYKKAGQNEKRILMQLTQGLETPKHATPMKTDETIFQFSNVTFKQLVQPFQKAFTPKGGMEFKPREIRLYQQKVDDSFVPDELEATWLGFLTNDSINRKDWPLVRWIIEKYYIPQINQDMELLEYYNGVYGNPTAGVAGITGTGMNGINHLLKAGLTDGTVQSLFSDIGALEKETIFDQLEDTVDLVSELYQGVEMEVCVSPKAHRWYMRDKRSQNFYQRTGAGDIDNSIDFTPQSVVPLPSMQGNDGDFFFTPKANFVHLTKKSKNKNKFKLEEAKRSIDSLADWWEGLGFGINEIVWTNINPAASGSN